MADATATVVWAAKMPWKIRVFLPSYYSVVAAHSVLGPRVAMVCLRLAALVTPLLV